MTIRPLAGTLSPVFYLSNNITFTAASTSLSLLLPSMSPTGILAGFFLLLALYCGIDPFKHSSISEFPEFKAYKVDLPDWSLAPTEKDKDELLQRSEIKFLNQVLGPESIAFDPLGRGPYTGVADGRILFWNGHSWTDFAYTSHNRYMFFFSPLLYVSC